MIINALKFRGQPDPVIDVSVENTGDYWEFVVSDNGIGIDEQHFEQIFVIFKRLHSREAYSGTGIGLALCKKIIENYGGRIWVTSKRGQGSQFHFTLPVLTN
jgi:light-regulated signal transduction histidine kinase (bacteriophytochrome)